MKIQLDLSQAIDIETFADPMAAAIILSLLCDARDTDEFGKVRGGWWGDALAEVPNDQWGSGRWTQARRLNRAETLRIEEDYDRKALAWMIEDGIASTIEVTAFDAGNEIMGVTIVIDGQPYELEIHNGL